MSGLVLMVLASFLWRKHIDMCNVLYISQLAPYFTYSCAYLAFELQPCFTGLNMAFTIAQSIIQGNCSHCICLVWCVCPGGPSIAVWVIL